MGRWTPKHYDEVLVTKIENLVNGAIRRCKQEDEEGKLKLQLSYEGFVENLDEGDSFTTTLIEILVKELADRQSRQNPADRRLINPRTSDSLHSLAVSNAYRSQPYNRVRNRSNANLSFTAAHSAAPHGWSYELSDSPDDDELDDMMGDSFGGVEGARMDSSTALYDVYGRPPSNLIPTASTRANSYVHPSRAGELPGIRPLQENPGATSQRLAQIPAFHQHQTAFRGMNQPRMHTSSTRGPAATPLTRQSSIRRPVRSRTNDFNEFSSRRRSTQRNSTNPEVEPDSPGSTSAALHGLVLPRRSPVDERPVIPPPPFGNYGASNMPRAALFDPPSPPPSGMQPSPSPPIESEEDFRRAIEASDVRPPATSLAFLVNPTQRSPRTIVASGPNSGPIPIPRLRRGGLRPPESMLATPEASSSPADTGSLLRPENTDEGVMPRPASDADLNFERDFGAWFDGRVVLPEPTELLRDEPPASLPTPRSVSPTEPPTATEQ